MTRPNIAGALAGLKDFQRATVEHAFRRLWLDDDGDRRFLVADEVGLGKTMVAKGVIAKTVDHLWDIENRIDIVYICSNSQIARQNLSRLNVVGGSELRHADRLTLLPRVIRELRDQRVNFVSFTPGTSFHVGSTGGNYDERVLLYWMLAEAWGHDAVRPNRWKRFFEGGVDRENFERYLSWFDRKTLDPQLCASFGEEIDQAVGPDGGPLREELAACVAEFNYLRGKPRHEVGRRRDALVGRLRQLVAKASVDHLQPDLVVLDEFQRFKDLLDADDNGAQLAQSIFGHPTARVLLLSATPYKMYTLPDEPEGDDHYRDFTRTVRFLAGAERAHVVERELRAMRNTLLVGGSLDAARASRDRVQAELRRVMSRTERLSSTPDRDGMLGERAQPSMRLAAADLRAWQTFDDVARLIDRHDVFEYWRSTPYPLNLMERNSYQVRTKFQAAVETNDPAVRKALEESQGLLDWESIRTYQRVDPGNAKMRGLFGDVLDEHEAWRLAWLPPSLPYYELGGAYGSPGTQSFTKRLIFSAWAVVPKAIAVMLSYEAERRTFEAAGVTERAYDARPLTPPLQFRMDGERPANMRALALFYPSLALARAGDPLDVARFRREPDSLPGRDDVLADVRARVAALLDELGHQPASDTPDPLWYAAAPFLLDQVLLTEENAPFEKRMLRWETGESDDQESRLGAHIRRALTLREGSLGAFPEDLADVLALMAVAGPGTCALRSLSRVSGGGTALADVNIRDSAYHVATGLRSLFNKPEIVALLRSADDDAYWRAVLDHCLDGCLQAVLDEYAHVLVESEGLQDAPAHDRSARLAEVMVESLSTRTAPNVVAQVSIVDGTIELAENRVNSHFAARYGRVQTDDKAAQRETTIRTAYNSPFRPFVLASTSVGQEGLDFHTYSHAIVHWNLPSNPVDLEQREGRVHRYKGHAVRKNIASAFDHAAFTRAAEDPWAAMFEAAETALVGAGSSGVMPYWIFTTPGGAVIERYVSALPLSREEQLYRRLQRTVGAYRMVIGQPRQDDLIRYVGRDQAQLDWLRIDLTPTE